MTYAFKIEIILDEEKIKKDGKYALDDVYYTILEAAQEQHLTRLKAEDEKILLFGKTGKYKDDFSECWIFQTSLLESDWFKKCVKKMYWYNEFNSSGNPENVLEEYYGFKVKGL